MAQFKLHKIPQEGRIRLIGEFYDAVGAVRGREEAKIFFRDLLFPDEIAMLVRRIQVALLLLAGYSYEDIQDALGVGTAKVAAVQRALKRDGRGYQLVVKRLRRTLSKKERKAERRSKARDNPMSIAALKQKYPAYFLLSNLLDELGDEVDSGGKLAIEKRIDNKKTSKAHPRVDAWNQQETIGRFG